MNDNHTGPKEHAVHGDVAHEDNRGKKPQSRISEFLEVAQDSQDSFQSLGLLAGGEQSKEKTSTIASSNYGNMRRTWAMAQTFWRRSWVPEILSYLLAIIAFTSLVVLLYLNQGKRVPEWPLGITINAMVAILTLITKGGLAVILSEGGSIQFRLSVAH